MSLGLREEAIGKMIALTLNTEWSNVILQEIE
jgi:hypothetical protein